MKFEVRDPFAMRIAFPRWLNVVVERVGTRSAARSRCDVDRPHRNRKCLARNGNASRFDGRKWIQSKGVRSWSEGNRKSWRFDRRDRHSRSLDRRSWSGECDRVTGARGDRDREVTGSGKAARLTSAWGRFARESREAHAPSDDRSPRHARHRLDRVACACVRNVMRCEPLKASERKPKPRFSKAFARSPIRSLRCLTRCCCCMRSSTSKGSRPSPKAAAAFFMSRSRAMHAVGERL